MSLIPWSARLIHFTNIYYLSFLQAYLFVVGLRCASALGHSMHSSSRPSTSEETLLGNCDMSHSQHKKYIIYLWPTKKIFKEFTTLLYLLGNKYNVFISMSGKFIIVLIIQQFQQQNLLQPNNWYIKKKIKNNFKKIKSKRVGSSSTGT